MPEIPVSALDMRQQRLVENACVALEHGNVPYVLEACASVLGAAPGCLPVRRLQRQAQLRRFRAGSRWPRVWWAHVRSLPLRFGARRPPDAVFRAAESVLELDPTNVGALRQLATAAERLDLFETAAFAREAIREIAPHDHENLLALGRVLLGLGQAAAALRLADAVLAARPLDPSAQDLMRSASIAATMSVGNWAAPGTFRTKLKSATQPPNFRVEPS